VLKACCQKLPRPHSAGTIRAAGLKKGETMATKQAAYTKPALRERIKKKIMKGTKGGRAGQWSARKAQLVAQEYKAQGGGYKGGKETKAQAHLNAWTKEDWQTSDGKKADRKKNGKKVMARYLPKKAWGKLSAAEKKSTNEKKEEGSGRGKQFVANTKKAAGARKKAAVAPKRTAKKEAPMKKNAAKKKKSPAKKPARKK
jgi:hypothetical protein